MGVRGLTTFIANRSSQYLQSYELHDSYLVIDGNSIASQLYKWHCKCNDCFGGDYDKYANVVKKFYQSLEDCHITPLVIFDGAYENRKLKTVYSRMRNKVGSVKRLTSVTEDSISVFPLFLRELFVDITLNLNVKCLRCDFEGDGEAAYLARNLNCPLLSYDSDFYIFDVLYIPFSTMELRVRKRKNVNYISCDIYNVDKFLNSFGGLDKINLPLLAVLLGNDYVKKSTFGHFYSQLKMQKSRDNPQQRMIKAVIGWLKNETPESALRKILGRYRLCNRKRVARKIHMGIKSYQNSGLDICSYFEVEFKKQQEYVITVPDPEDIELINEEIIENEDPGSSGSASEEEDIPEQEPVNKLNLPSSFYGNYKKCVYPPCFMDMVVSHRYYSIPQMEDYSQEQSHAISADILAAIYKILTCPSTRNLTCLVRNDYSNIKKFRLPTYNREVPKLSDIKGMDAKTRKEILFDILNIKHSNTFDLFPSTWHLFLISLKYWITNSKCKVNMSYIFSLILCGIVLNFVDSKMGFYRSTQSFSAKYGGHITKSTSSNRALSITDASKEIDLNDCVSCMRKLIDYFQMEAKMKSNIRLFDVQIVHHFAEFQSVLLHVKYLNALLDFPYSTFLISDFYDGTFLYNMTMNLAKRSSVKSYIKILLEDSPKVLNVFELMIEQIEAEISPEMLHAETSKKKRKKKKKKNRNSVSDDNAPVVIDSDGENVIDPNNIYSLLSVINK